MPTGAEAPRALDTASPVSTADYFSEEEYRAVVRDEEVGDRAQWPDIERYQMEVIERLEAWARAAWRRRTRTERIRVGATRFALSRVPVISVNAATFDGVALAGHQFESNGVFRWGEIDNDWQTLEYSGILEVTYTYGFDAVPWSIKRPCIEATQALAWSADPENNIPPNTESYTNQGTTIRFAQVDPYDVCEPWPWNERASAEVRSFWERHRPRRFIVGA